MRIGEFARHAGVRTSKIRFYEEHGLLPRAARLANGYRSYDAADLRIITFINEARTLGFSLTDVSRFMEQSAEEKRDKRSLVGALEKKLAAVDQHLDQMRQQRNRISALLSRITDSSKP